MVIGIVSQWGVADVTGSLCDVAIQAHWAFTQMVCCIDFFFTETPGTRQTDCPGAKYLIDCSFPFSRASGVSGTIVCIQQHYIEYGNLSLSESCLRQSMCGTHDFVILSHPQS